MGALDDLDGTAEEAIQPRPDIEGLEVSLIGTILVDEVCLLAQLAGLHLEADTTYITGSFSLQQTLPMQGTYRFNVKSTLQCITLIRHINVTDYYHYYYYDCCCYYQCSYLNYL